MIYYVTLSRIKPASTLSPFSFSSLTYNFHAVLFFESVVASNLNGEYSRLSCSKVAKVVNYTAQSLFFFLRLLGLTGVLRRSLLFFKAS
jgi:hypothetical protein